MDHGAIQWTQRYQKNTVIYLCVKVLQTSVIYDMTCNIEEALITKLHMNLSFGPYTHRTKRKIL